MSSQSPASSSRLSAGATGTASTSRAGRMRASPRNAALTVPPVAIPSSTTIAIRPSTPTGGQLAAGIAAVPEQRPEHRHLSASIPRQMIQEPAHRVVLHLVERARLLEQVGRTLDDHQLLRRPEPVIGHPVQLDDLGIEAAD